MFIAHEVSLYGLGQTLLRKLWLFDKPVDGMTKFQLILFLLAVISACKPFPKDANKTLEKAQKKVLKVGLSGYDSTANASRRSVDFEIDLVEGFAKEINAKIEWVKGPQSEIAHLLHYNYLHMAIGGYTSPSPFEKEVSFTKPYMLKAYKVGAAGNQAIPEDIKNKRVMVHCHMAAFYVQKEGGIPVLSDSLRAGNYLIAASEEDLKKIKVRLSEITLHEEKFVIAVPKGENAFLMRLEKFLDVHGKVK